MPLEGAKELKQQIKLFKAGARPALGAALYEEALAVMPGAIRDCPWQFKFLRNSGYVKPPDVSGSKLQVTLGFSRWYGLFVEERDDVSHPHGKAHFLRDNFTKAIPGMLERIARRARRHIIAGTGLAAGDLPTTPPDSGHPGDERDELSAIDRVKGTSLAKKLPGAAKPRGGR